MSYRAFTLLMLSWCAPAMAENFRVFTDVKQSQDSDHQKQSNVAVGYQSSLPQLGTGAFWATRLGHRHLESPDGTTSFEYLQLDGQRPLADNAGVQADLALTHGSDWSPVLGSLSAHWLPTKDWRLEASGERDLVDTILAVRNRTSIDTGAMSVDWALTSTITAVVAASYSSFSDGNDRLTRSARLAWSPAEWQWFNLQMRAKRADSDAVGVGYFNPRRLEEYEAQARLAGSPFSDQWVLSLMAGVGQQRIDHNSPSRIYSLETKARGWFSAHYGLEGRAACSNTGSLSGTAAQSGYRFCQVGVQLITSW